jgi:hypothetical protein
MTTWLKVSLTKNNSVAVRHGPPSSCLRVVDRSGDDEPARRRIGSMKSRLEFSHGIPGDGLKPDGWDNPP